MWRKKIDSSHLHSFDFVVLSIVALLIAGIATQHITPYAVAGIFTAHLVLLKVFDRQSINEVTIDNPKRRIRLFPGEKDSFTMEVKNDMFFPLVNGEITFNLGHQVKVLNDTSEGKGESPQSISIPLSLLPRKKVNIQLPIEGVTRGTARVNKLAIHYHQLFSFHSEKMLFQQDYETELIIYPKLKKVEGVESVFHMHAGSARLMHSPFEDIQDIIGTRDYTYSDSFQRINWKASVRSKELQTNVYQRVADRSLVFLVNLQTGLKAGASEKLEDLLSYTAYLCNYATEEDQSYEVMINIFQPGRTPFLHQYEGNGSSQLMKSLEMLARISKQAAVQPFENMLFYLSKKQKQPKTFIILGNVPCEAMEQMKHLMTLGHQIFYVDDSLGAATISRLNVERTA